MKRIITAVNDSSSSNALVEYDGGMKLKIVTGEQKRTLSDDLYSKWEVKKQKGSKNEKIAVGNTKIENEGSKCIENRSKIISMVPSSGRSH